jgi:hypothetical protein
VPSFFPLHFTCKLRIFCLWASLDSNQGPLPYQRSRTFCQRFQELEKSLQITAFSS